MRLPPETIEAFYDRIRRKGFRIRAEDIRANTETVERAMEQEGIGGTEPVRRCSIIKNSMCKAVHAAPAPRATAKKAAGELGGESGELFKITAIHGGLSETIILLYSHAIGLAFHSAVRKGIVKNDPMDHENRSKTEDKEIPAIFKLHAGAGNLSGQHKNQNRWNLFLPPARPMTAKGSIYKAGRKPSNPESITMWLNRGERL